MKATVDRLRKRMARGVAPTAFGESAASRSDLRNVAQQVIRRQGYLLHSIWRVIEDEFSRLEMIDEVEELNDTLKPLAELLMKFELSNVSLTTTPEGEGNG